MNMRNTPILALAILMAGLSVPDSAAAKDKTGADSAPEAQGLVTIDTTAPSRPYSPMLFGGFIEHFDDQIYGGLFEPGSPRADERGFRKDVIAAMKELKLSVVRWPGGCFVSGYHWKDGVGKERQPVPDPVWGATDPNTFGTDEFVEWCRLVGCEPYICTNAGNGTPEEMRQWVEYCNGTTGEYAELRKANGHEQPYKVKYWSIGNENYGYWEIGRKTPETWGPLVHQCAGLMQAADPDIELAAAAWLDKREWNLPLLKAAGADLSYMAVHSYWHNKEKPITYKECMKFCGGPEKTIIGVVKNIEEAGFRGKIKIAYDEWNLRHWFHPGFPRKGVVRADDEKAAEFIKRREDNAIDSTYTMADAVFTSAFLNACLRHCDDVGMANIAPIVNTRGPLRVHPKGIVRRTTFHTLAMYANDLEARVVPMNLEAGQRNEQLDGIATTDESGKRWAIALTNRDPEANVVCTIKLGDQLLDGTFDIATLAGDSPDAFNDAEHPDRVVPVRSQIKVSQGKVSLPPHSLSIIRIL
ncbi:MAG: alpha-N-arabinofuranosidase [Verrucomicrobia bacterium]|jgi:alpha-L-arabinofuranosidase|nr:alpha-N-arabinofuranosidase [Verrucomicrobiota bacterium]MDA1004912.1 alpha-N-arabinofuranosidase [Verrucomicrobiota bacterium]